MTIDKCSLGFGATLGLYLGIATMDDNNKRKTDVEAAKV